MLGRTVAIAVMAEVKRAKNAKISKEQADFIANAKAAGAIAGICRSWEEAREMVRAWIDR